MPKLCMALTNYLKRRVSPCLLYGSKDAVNCNANALDADAVSLRAVECSQNVFAQLRSPATCVCLGQFGVRRNAKSMYF
jgi:hypothetical protein